MPPPERTRLHSFLRTAAAALLAAFSLLAAVPPARAQSLLELYETARRYDAAYLAARAQAEAAVYRTAQTEALMRPNVSAAGSATRSETKLPAFDAARAGSTVGLTLSGRQPLFNRTSRATIDQSYKSLELAQQDLFAVEQDLILRLAQAYFDVLAAHDTLATTRASKMAIAEQLAAAKRNFEVGTATITDTREAQARFDLATAQEIAAQNDLRIRRIALDQLVGRSDVVPLPLAVPVVLPPVQPASLEEWVARAEAEHPNVQRARLALDIASIEIEKARAGHLPTLDAVAQLANTRNNGGASVFSGTTRSASLGVQLNVPIFSGYSVENRIRETLLLEDKARNDLDAARRAVAQATRREFFTVQSGRARVDALRAAESSSQLALDATQLGYQVGVRINVDVLNSQSQLFATRRDLAHARYDVLLGSLRLRQASGRLGPEDVAALNAVLASEPAPPGVAPGTAVGRDAGGAAVTTSPAMPASVVPPPVVGPPGSAGRGAGAVPGIGTVPGERGLSGGSGSAIPGAGLVPAPGAAPGRAMPPVPSAGRRPGATPGVTPPAPPPVVVVPPSASPLPPGAAMPGATLPPGVAAPAAPVVAPGATVPSDAVDPSAPAAPGTGSVPPVGTAAPAGASPSPAGIVPPAGVVPPPVPAVPPVAVPSSAPRAPGRLSGDAGAGEAAPRRARVRPCANEACTAASGSRSCAGARSSVPCAAPARVSAGATAQDRRTVLQRTADGRPVVPSRVQAVRLARG